MTSVVFANWYKGWLYQPFITLQPVASTGNPATSSLLHALQVFRAGKGYQRPLGQTGFFPSFRQSLLQQLNQPNLSVADVLALPADTRTPEWSQLSNALAYFTELTPERQAQTLWVLNRLGFLEETIAYAPAVTDDQLLNNPVMAEIAYIKALSAYYLYLDGADWEGIGEFARIALHAAQNGFSAIDASYHCAQACLKMDNDAEGADYWLGLHQAQIAAATPEIDQHTFHLLTSRYYRIKAMIPQFKGDKERMVEDMELAEYHAGQLLEDTLLHRLEKANVTTACAESRIKEALVLGDWPLAEERARKLVTAHSTFAIAWLHLGQVLVEQEKWQEASQAYRTAARVGPQGTPMAYYMMGQCYEQLKDNESAAEAYLASLYLEPNGIAAAERLAHLSSGLGSPTLAAWSSQHLDHLNQLEQEALQQQEAMPSMPVYKQYEGALGKEK